MKKSIQISTLVIAIVTAILFAICIISYNYFPNHYIITENASTLNVQYDYISIAEKKDNNINVLSTDTKKISDSNGKLMLCGVIPIKDVSLEYETAEKLIPCGSPFGIKLFTEGVVVVKIDDIKIDNQTYSPGNDAQIKIGDIITKVNDIKVSSNEELVDLVNKSKGEEITLDIVRDEKNTFLKITPVKTSDNGDYKIGIWVRDSSAGIGTITYYDEESHDFGGLGHGITDVDTGKLLPLNKGELVTTQITDITKSYKGNAGTLNGYFESNNVIGSLDSNTECGVFGELEQSPVEGEEIPIATKQEIKTGTAQIISTINSDEPEYYDINVEYINYDEESKTRNLIIEITDETLLEKTGGIVQGMSGSPIIQDNKIIGAVTHVFLNEPSKGYGIFIENMLESAENIT